MSNTTASKCECGEDKRCECGQSVYDTALDGNGYCIQCLEEMDEREEEEKRRAKLEIMAEGDR